MSTLKAVSPKRATAFSITNQEGPLFLTPETTSILQGKEDSITITKSGLASQAYLAHSFLSQGQSIAVIVPGKSEFARFQALLSIFRNPSDLDFGHADWVFIPPLDPREKGRGNWEKMQAGLYALAHASGPQGVVFTYDSLLLKLPPKSAVIDHSVQFIPGGHFDLEYIIEKAIRWGYVRAPLVARPGEIAVRGDILDIFCPGYDTPLRLEFFGPTLESLRLFEPVTQRSVRELTEATMLPVHPCLTTPAYVEEAKQKWHALWNTGVLSKEGKTELEQALIDGFTPRWPGMYYQETSMLGDWLPQGTVFFLADAPDARTRLEQAEWSNREVLTQEGETRGWDWPLQTIFNTVTQARQTWVGQRQLLFEPLVMGHAPVGVALPEKEYADFEELFWREKADNRPWHVLVEKLKYWSTNHRQVVLSFHTEASRQKFLKLMAQEGLSIPKGFEADREGLCSVVSPLSQGFSLSWNTILVLPEDVLQPSTEVREKRRHMAFSGLKSFDEIKPGDYLVHRDYGVACFGGLSRLDVGSISNDYLLLFYANDDKVYLPVDRLSLVQKYKGFGEEEAVLDRLGGMQWKKAKEQAKKAIEKIAFDLVEMYAYRKIAKGFSYGPLNELYRELEASFGFEETPDQAAAIQDVLNDMDRPEPMDRLVCGDVGFGKTEVAMRAALRAVLDGRQVAILCPTTVLAEQHYQNFRRRMQSLPVQVAMLSRFVSAADQNRVLGSLKRGEVDICIGTHRLLSKDVQFSNLGLLILDEEQRFGVSQKEKIKILKQNIDVLTLTATPIPRTLQLSLSGIRSLSVIETPPPDRKPVDTFLIERDKDVLQGVVQRELDRRGQVFWVHNRVQGLAEVRNFVASLVPDARVEAAHGQMPERQLEDVMHRFWHGEVDVLVCTSIIESGLDFPRANTLVVDGAHLFGLGQLYQIRGRVGRSERQAFAYFVVPSLDSMPDKARKRLQVIMDMDYLGAGFQIAMEDLRLRGTGNILGEAQSGHINKVGLDLFLEMLDQEVHRLKGEPRRVEIDPELNIGFNAHIPETYIPDASERLKYYKALASADNEQTLLDLVQEIRDRFGSMPEPLDVFIEVVHLKKVLARLGVLKADIKPTHLTLTWPEKTEAVRPEDLVSWINGRSERARMLPPGKVEYRLMGEKMKDRLISSRLDLERIHAVT